ncbi:NAD(P)/FAD-dependent oxidoreductase [Clostridium sp. AL.422]|uniref:flavin monoamine oxidase family protein n=1 Tax=Clostridium TaxID=1485 RepID=UPI00293DB73B|nr:MULTISPECIES: NAD(P)/FAD-dependent oxidoreductase [unclassified Clostridium]MDV4151105.1 NAD(P)/FAD-dependent oxidoreductase [Clostridium sp. AL.422]
MEEKYSKINKYPINNPSDYDRYITIENELKKEGRIEDIENIINLMSPPEDIRSICKSEQGKKVNVAIVGTGEAGLAAAYELKKIGCNITVFEASKRIGGRVYTHSFDRNNKYYGDFGEGSIPISHYTTWHYINLFKLGTNVCNNNNQYYYLRNAGAYNKERQIAKNIYPRYDLTRLDKIKLKAKDHLNIYNKYLNDLKSEERQELIQIKDNYSKNIKNLDKLSLKEAYRLEGFSEDAINMIGYINGVTEFYNASITEILQKKYTLDNISSYNISGGMIKLPQSLYEAIIEENLKSYSYINKEELGKVNVKLGFYVDGVNNLESKVKVNYLDSEKNIHGSDEFDYLIITISPNSIKRMNISESFSKDKLRSIDEISFKNSQKVYLYLKERFWELERKNKRIIGGRTITDLPLYSIYYPSDNASVHYDKNNKEIISLNKNSKTPGVLLASYSFGDKSDEFSYLSDDIKINDIINYIEKIHNLPKGYLDSIVLDYKSIVWSDVQYIWGFSNLYKPQDKTFYSYSNISPEMDNKIFFAGDNATAKHGTQQGALQSGMIAANNVAAEIKRKYSQ